MLKKRIVANVVVKNGIVVQSINFHKYLPVGRPPIAVEFLNNWGIDEIVLTDITASSNKREPDYEIIKKTAKKCFVPLTVAGGITKIDHIKRLMQCGADKISLNSAALANPDLIKEAAMIFGNQCVVVTIDAIRQGKEYRVFDHLKRAALDLTPETWAARCENNGAGEIFIQSVDRDGTYSGFDTELINKVCESVSVPVVCMGGAGTAKDFVDVFSKTNVSGASAANMFHFIEHSVNILKAQTQVSQAVRIETHADYLENVFDTDYRLAKKDDAVLEAMLYTKIEKEIL